MRRDGTGDLGDAPAERRRDARDDERQHEKVERVERPSQEAGDERSPGSRGQFLLGCRNIRPTKARSPPHASAAEDYGELLGDVVGEGVGEGVGVVPGGICAPYIVRSQICVWRTVTFGTEKEKPTVWLCGVVNFE